MSGIDGYTKLLLHCDGTDESTTFTDSSDSPHTVTANGDAQIDTAIKKFGTASGLFDGTGDYLSVPYSSDWDFGSGDFTIDFWVYRNGSQTENSGLISSNSNNGDGWELSFGDSASGSIDKIILLSDASGSWGYNLTGNGTIPNQTWTHIALVRYGNTLKLYINGILDQSLDVTGYNYNSNNLSLLIGRLRTDVNNFYFNGNLDEIRISKGIARWTSNFTPPTSEYSGTEESTEINETVTLSDNWNIQTNPGSTSIEETITLDDDWDIQTNPGQVSFSETVTLSDDWDIKLNREEISFSENITIDDDWSFDLIGDIYLKYQTNLRTAISKIYKYMTNLIVSVLLSNKYATNLITKVNATQKYATDLRLKVVSLDVVQPETLNDIIVKLDGSELVDVDYSTLHIQYNLNNTPSSAYFQLARRHDNLDYLLDGVTSSEITNENKIEIYDGTDKLLTAYITQIEALSSTDTVMITAEDVRYKFSRNSMEVEYGGKVEADEDNEEVYNRFEKNIGTALSEVLSAISPYISGYESVPFQTSFTPEYAKIYEDYGSLLNTLITQTANVNWYIDANEYLRFQTINAGTIKELSLSPLNGARTIYDVILDDVTLNKQRSGYVKSLNVKLGSHIIQKWSRRTFTGWMNSYVDFCNHLKERTSFCFQQWGNYGQKWYCGINKTIYGYCTRDWVLKPTIVVQWQSKDSDNDLADITVGSGLPKKTIHLSSYGKKETSVRWEERINSSDDKTYLCYVTDDTYDNIDYATDCANFELSQNNRLQTSARITLLLDAFKYYNINLKDRINLGNTISSSIYKSNNGFPLNIESISIDCSTRIVTLNATNYGKSSYVRTENYLKNITIPRIRYKQEIQNIIQYLTE